MVSAAHSDGPLLKNNGSALSDKSEPSDKIQNFGAEAQNIPLPKYYPPVGIITAKYDGKVSFKRTTIPGNVPFQRTTVKSNHPDVRLPQISGEMILKFFREKKFF